MPLYRKISGDLAELPTITASEAKNRLGSLLDQVGADGPIAITRHDLPKAVVLSIRDFEMLYKSTIHADQGIDDGPG